MKRDLGQLSEKTYDVVVIGGGIYGLFTAWDAALRGLSVALVEKGDFGHATSFNSLRVIHGGLRYLQHGDLGRMRASIRERTNLMRMAPYLVRPLPFLIPTYGHSLRGREALALALKLHDLVGFDRNRLSDPDKRLPASRTLSRRECLQICPEMAQPGLSGGGLVYDCQLYSSERLIAAVLRSATEAGACPANYLEATGFITHQNGVSGVRARDLLSGGELDIRARLVVNSTGPWVEEVWRRHGGHRPGRNLPLSRAFNLLVNRPLAAKYAVGVYSKDGSNDGDARISKGSRLFFIIPWRGYSLIGTEHLPYDGSPDNFAVTTEDAQRFLEEINEAYPPARLTMADVCQVYGGLLPADGHTQGDVRLTRHYRIYDHHKEDGRAGLVSVAGVKFTEARHVAEKVVDLVLRKLGQSPHRSRTAVTPVYGGYMERFDSFLDHQMRSNPRGLSAGGVKHLVYHYGSAYPEVLQHLGSEPSSAPAEDEALRILRAEVVHSVRQEMAQKLADVVLRRTSAGLAIKTGDLPGDYLATCAEVMAGELGWSRARTQEELEEVADVSTPRVATV